MQTDRGIYLAIFNVVEILLHILCCNLPIIFYLFVHGINRIKPAKTRISNTGNTPKVTWSFSTTSTSHKRINSNISTNSFHSSNSGNSSNSTSSSNSSNSTDYWLRLCNSYILNDMAPRTVIFAGGSAPFDAAAASTTADEKADDVSKSDFDADVEEFAAGARCSVIKLPKDGIVVKQEIVRSVSRRDSSWNGY